MARTIDKQLLERAEIIRKSGLFDEAEYPFRTLAAMSNQDLIQHYLTYGEPRGAKPSCRFDPSYYARRYGISGDSPLLHYILLGRKQGFDPLPLASRYSYKVNGFRPGFKRVVLLVHEGNLSGAPVLGWNIVVRLKDHADVIVLLARTGGIQQAFLDVAAAIVHPDEDMRHLFNFSPLDIELLAGEVLTRFDPHAVLCNSVENAPLVEAFGRRAIPCVTLVHEFAERYRPGQLRGVFAYSSHVVFPAKIVRNSAFRAYPALASRRVDVIPQGQSDIPMPHAASIVPAEPDVIGDSFIVLGCGNMEIRKGIDIFIATAASLKRLKPKHGVKFVWIGVDQTHHSYELMLLYHQLRESGLNGTVEFVSPTPAFKQYLARSSIFFLSSRLDPLPNVAIDAMMDAKPVICFDGASGLPEYLESDALLKTCIVPYLDSAAAAKTIARLMDDPRLLAETGKSARQRAERIFQMTDYAASLLKLLRESEQLLAPLQSLRGKGAKVMPEDDLVLRALDTGNVPRFDV